MVKFYENFSTFFYSWDQFASAFWNRYPNPYSSHVLSEDILVREMRGDMLYTQRLLTKTNRVPKWGEGFVKAANVAIVEESYINPKNKTITTYTRNIGYARVMSVVEKVIYKPNPLNPNETTASRWAWIGSQIFGFRRAIEGFGLERFKKNCSEAVHGFNYVLQGLFPPLKNDNNAQLVTNNLSVSRFGETTEKIKEKARRASLIAKEKAGAIKTVYVACQDPTSTNVES